MACRALVAAGDIASKLPGSPRRSIRGPKSRWAMAASSLFPYSGGPDRCIGVSVDTPTGAPKAIPKTGTDTERGSMTRSSRTCRIPSTRERPSSGGGSW